MSNDPDWGLRRTFLAVAEEGSLSGAARRLGLTQPTVARHIGALEAAIGAELFLRTPRGMIPTDMGRALEPHAQTLAATAAALMREAGGTRGEVRGAVRVSASEVMGVEHLPQVFTRLRRRHPDLVVELVVSNVVDDLMNRGADIAVRNVEPTQAALVARRLPPIPLGLHARADYLARRGAPRAIEDLAGHDLIGFDRETPAIRAILRRYPTLGRDAYAFRADSDLAQLAAIRAGFGIGLCQAAAGRPRPRPRPGARGRRRRRPRRLGRHARGPAQEREVPGRVRCAGGGAGGGVRRAKPNLRHPRGGWMLRRRLCKPAGKPTRISRRAPRLVTNPTPG